MRARTSGHAILIRGEGKTDPRHDGKMLVQSSYNPQSHQATPGDAEQTRQKLATEGGVHNTQKHLVHSHSSRAGGLCREPGWGGVTSTLRAALAGTSMTFSFSPVVFALQSEIQNHRSKRGRLKSAKYYPYRSSRRKHHKAKSSDSKVQKTRGM